MLAPTNATIQRYPPGARYAEHTDTHCLGRTCVAPRSFTALVYAHAGWRPGLGGELTVQPRDYVTGSAKFTGTVGAPNATIVPPRGGTLALFPSHLVHEVSPVSDGQNARYAVTMWISLEERRAPAEAAALARQLSSSEWIDAFADYGQIANIDGRAGLQNIPPGTIIANSEMEMRGKVAMQERLRARAISRKGRTAGAAEC